MEEVPPVHTDPGTKVAILPSGIYPGIAPWVHLAHTLRPSSAPGVSVAPTGVPEHSPGLIFGRIPWVRASPYPKVLKSVNEERETVRRVTPLLQVRTEQ